jgi:hypothetical protein
MKMLAAFMFTASILAQEGPPVGILRGDLVERDGTATAGELAVRAADSSVYRCSYDVKTYFERDKERISATTAKAGDKVEIISDRRQGNVKCYAMLVHIEKVAPNPPVAIRRLRLGPSPTESIFPRGNLTFSGVVVRVNPSQLVLRTRVDGPKTILLRQDTRYFADGEGVAVSNLIVNTRVYIRAGKTFEDQLEAFQVMWGDILNPK